MVLTLFKKVFVFSLVIIALCQAIENIEWDYESSADWGLIYPFCAGTKQSPINIDNDVPADTSVTFHWEKNEDELEVEYINNGNTVEITPGTLKASIDFDENTYKVHKMVIHWGSDLQKGSEHSFNKQFYQGEIQVLHYNTKYESYEEATKRRDGLAIVAIPLQRLNERIVQFPNILNQISWAAQHIIQPDSSHIATNERYSLEDLKPENNAYVRYSGSLSTPPCTENVEWIVFTTPRNVFHNLFKRMQEITKTGKGSMSNNVRPVQKGDECSIVTRCLKKGLGGLSTCSKA